jgi:hypothetical protein
MESPTFEILSIDPNTQLPTPVQVTTSDLREALLKNPALLVGALHDVLERRFNPNLQQAEAPITLDTPIRALITETDFQRLSDRARQLTRQDLIALGSWGDVPRKTPRDLGLTVEDIQTIRDIFGKQIVGGLGMMDIFGSVSCCSCTPCCCCAVAVAPPARALA